MINVTINGHVVQFESGITVSDILNALSKGQELSGIAVYVNGVPCEGDTQLNDDCELEIFTLDDTPMKRMKRTKRTKKTRKTLRKSRKTTEPTEKPRPRRQHTEPTEKPRPQRQHPPKNTAATVCRHTFRSL